MGVLKEILTPEVMGIDGIDFNPPCQRCSERDGEDIAACTQHGCINDHKRVWLCKVCLKAKGFCRVCERGPYGYHRV